MRTAADQTLQDIELNICGASLRQELHRLFSELLKKDPLDDPLLEQVLSKISYGITGAHNNSHTDDQIKRAVMEAFAILYHVCITKLKFHDFQPYNILLQEAQKIAKQAGQKNTESASPTSAVLLYRLNVKIISSGDGLASRGIRLIRDNIAEKIDTACLQGGDGKELDFDAIKVQMGIADEQVENLKQLQKVQMERADEQIGTINKLQKADSNTADKILLRIGFTLLGMFAGAGVGVAFGGIPGAIIGAFVGAILGFAYATVQTNKPEKEKGKSCGESSLFSKLSTPGFHNFASAESAPRYGLIR